MQRIAVQILTAVGGGASVDTARVSGTLESVVVDPGSWAGTVDVQLSEKDTGLTLATFTNVGSETRQNPRCQAYDASGNSLPGVYEPTPVSGRVTIVVSEAGGAETGTVYLYIGEPFDVPAGVATLIKPTDDIAEYDHANGQSNPDLIDTTDDPSIFEHVRNHPY